METIDTAEKLANALRDFSPTINDEDVKVIFNDLNEGYKIGRIAEHKNGWVYDEAIKYIKKEFRHQFKVIYINLGYRGDFCPQDMPYRMLLIRTTTGEVITPEQIVKRYRNDA